MEKLTKKNKLIILILAVIIIAGIAVIATIGFNFELSMQKNNKVQFYIEKDFEISDIKNIANEVFGNEQVVIQKVEVFEDTVMITAKEINEEQVKSLVGKLNEKYELELDADSVEIEEIPNMKLTDLLMPYVYGFCLASILIIVYMMLRYKKLGIAKVLIETILTIVIPQAVLFSVIAITRIPVGRLTIPMVIIIYLTSLFIYTCNQEKQLAKIKEDEE